MKYNKIMKGVFLERPNRFEARVIPEDTKKPEIVHVKNTGRCRELLVDRAEVILSVADNPKRKTRCDLIGVYKMGLGYVNMDSQAPNAMVKEWLVSGQEMFPGITYLKPEYTYKKSRFDFYFEQGEKKTLLEIKGVTLEYDGAGYFPDAPTQRGVKHIRELIEARKEGYEAYIGFVIQMTGIKKVFPNDSTDPEFGKALREAVSEGVKILYLGGEMEPEEVKITKYYI